MQKNIIPDMKPCTKTAIFFIVKVSVTKKKQGIINSKDKCLKNNII